MAQGIQTTTDYDKFTLIKGNREVKAGHTASLAVSILKHNMLAQNPIIVNSKMEVIDGQHRLEVARTNKLPISYIVLDNADIAEVISLNQAQRAWTANDFIDSYAARGNEEYIWLRNFTKEQKIAVSNAVIFTHGSNDSWVYTAIKTGRFVTRPEQREDAERRAGVLWELRPFLNVTGVAPKALYTTIVKLDKEGKTQDLVKGIRTRAVPFKPASNVFDMQMQLGALL